MIPRAILLPILVLVLICTGCKPGGSGAGSSPATDPVVVEVDPGSGDPVDLAEGSPSTGETAGPVEGEIEGGLPEDDTGSDPGSDAPAPIEIAYPTLEGLTGHPEHTVLVYGAADGARLPVMVFIHGGGWQTGDKCQHGTKAEFFRTEGWVFVSVDYRLSPEIMHPGHVEDVAAALAWVFENIASHGGDPDRVFVMGHSAGAHLAALVSTDERYLEAHGHALQDLSGTVLLDGAGYDIPLARELNPRGFERTYVPAFGRDQATLEDASPVHHVVAGKGIPPTLVIHVPRHMAEVAAPAYASALQDAGVPTELWLAEGETHASLNKGLGTPGEPTNQVVLDFLDSVP